LPMRRLFLFTLLTLAPAGSFALSPAARAEDRSVDQIVKDISKVEMPEIDPSKKGDRAAMVEYFAKRQQAMIRRAELIGELYKADPENAKLVQLLPERWQALFQNSPTISKELRDELDKVATTGKDAKLKADAAYFGTIAALRETMAGAEQPGKKVDTDSLMKAIDGFTKIAPKDERGASLIFTVGSQFAEGAKQAELFKRVVKDYPGSGVAKMVEANLKKLEAVGKPFDLEFTEAIKGTTVSMKDLKGKVVVVDFWATWCGPCIAEMPKMKKLYAEYKDKGVEFIGVSLDNPKEEGGLDKLKEYVSQNGITWPQYYQGKGWESDFSRSWGIDAIPAVFVVDTQGKIHSIDARGKLEEMIPELLKKAKTGAGAGAGAGGL